MTSALCCRLLRFRISSFVLRVPIMKSAMSASGGVSCREFLHYLYYFYGLFLHFSKINAVLNSESLPLVEINLIIKP